MEQKDDLACELACLLVNRNKSEKTWEDEACFEFVSFSFAPVWHVELFPMTKRL